MQSDRGEPILWSEFTHQHSDEFWGKVLAFRFRFVSLLSSWMIYVFSCPQQNPGSFEQNVWPPVFVIAINSRALFASSESLQGGSQQWKPLVGVFATRERGDKAAGLCTLSLCISGCQPGLSIDSVAWLWCKGNFSVCAWTGDLSRSSAEWASAGCYVKAQFHWVLFHVPVCRAPKLQLYEPLTLDMVVHHHC